jgi:hypothetical protein
MSQRGKAEPPPAAGRLRVEEPQLEESGAAARGADFPENLADPMKPPPLPWGGGGLPGAYARSSEAVKLRGED